MPEVRIPEEIKEYFRDKGLMVGKLETFLELENKITPVFLITPKTPTYPQMFFQGGKGRTIAIIPTAGTVETDLSPGEGKRWLLLSGTIVLVADANPANRKIFITLTDGTNEIDRWGFSATITAGQTKIHAISRYTGSDGLQASTNRVSGHQIANGLILDEEDVLKIDITGGLGGDSYSGFFKVLEVDV